MRFFFFLILLLLGFYPNTTSIQETRPQLFEFEKTGDGQSRCCNPGCLTRVTPGQKELVAKVLHDSRASSIFFDEGSSRLQQSEVEKIKKFLDANDDVQITLIGYTDGCGGIGYNKSLSMNRAVAVMNKLRQMKTGLTIKIKAAGEISHGHDPKSRKVHLTSTKNVILYEPPPEIIADYYLIDGSGSMSGTKFELYRRAINYHRPPGSKVYVATSGCAGGMKSFNSFSPSGSTEIWYAYWSIMDKMSPGQTLVIISDFDSRYPLTGRERQMLNNKARSKKIKVRAISV